MDKKYSIHDMKFHRKFSVNPYKSLKMKLGEMSFSKDWLNTNRGDPYPATFSDRAESLCRATGDGRYCVINTSECDAAEARLLGQHFPYATYELVLGDLHHASAGFSVRANFGPRSAYSEQTTPEIRIFFTENSGSVQIGHELLVGGVSQGVVREPDSFPFTPGIHLIVTFRGRFADIYVQNDKKPFPVLTLDLPEFSDITLHGTFTEATASLWTQLMPEGRFTAESVEFYLDGGVSHADMKPIRYEDGSPILSDGKIFLTFSSRLQAGGFQSVLSWNPSGCEFKLEGAIFFDCGDDRWCADVASSVIFNRQTNEWYIWACSFSHGHILCHGTSTADLRYGINVIDAHLMPCENTEAAGDDALRLQAGMKESFRATLSNDKLWLAKTGDEDPDFVYDRTRGKWYMTICRHVEENGKSQYRYFLFSSDSPFSGYQYVDHTRSGANTGGSIVRIGGKLQFICGTDFDKRARYNVYDFPDFSECSHLLCDWDDGGFRGWGTVIPIPCGSRTKYMWITFDRHGGSDYTWSYGNIYVYESDLMNPGYETPVQYNL